MTQIDAFERRFSAAALKSLTPETWDLFVRTINARLKGVEEKKADFEEAERTLLDLGLARINETIQPAAERIYHVAELGFLVASSDTEVELAEGQEVLLTIQDGDQRELFVPTPFLALVRRSSYTDYAIASLVSYDQETGQLLVLIKSVTGNPGPHNDWDVAALAGHVMAMDDALKTTQELRDEVADDLATVEAHKATVAADKATVASDKITVAADRSAAEIARVGAEAAFNAASELLEIVDGGTF